MARRPQANSIYRIAEEAGVSVATVSRAMNNRTGVSEPVRARIAELLAKYNFIPNYPTARHHRIAFLTWDDTSGYILSALRGILEYARNHDVDVNLVFRFDSPGENLFQQIRDQQCAGVIAGPGESFRKVAGELSRLSLPVMLLDTVDESGHLGYIDNDSYAGALAAARHLIELGHRKIGYLRYYFPENAMPFDHRQRFKGYEDAMTEAGLAIHPAWIIHNPATDDTSRGAAGIAAMNQLLRQAPEITAVMTTDDNMAFGALSAIHRCGRRVPEDISVVGFGNSEDTGNWFVALTTVDHQITRAGYLAAEAIDRMLKCPGGTQLPRLTMPTSLVVRQSTGPVPASP